ncbi:MAG: SRPBCC domain-containing protein [Bdellovibrionota bacterium]
MQQSTTQNSQETNQTFNVEKYPLVEITRKLSAPVERVWTAWTTPELVKQWWGPVHYTCPEAKIDLRKGGQTFMAMQGPDGKIMYSGGVIEEIIPDTKIVTADQFMDKDGHPIPAKEYGMSGDWPEGGGRMTIEFNNSGANETQIHIVHEGIPKDMHDDCIDGWSTSIDKLQKLVERS